MPDDNIYMTPFPENVGDIFMTPTRGNSGIIYMSPIVTPTEAWKLIGVYAFVGTTASTSWSGGSLGSYSGYSAMISTDARQVRLMPKSGWWYDGSHYRGMMDIKSKEDWTHVGYDWTGSYYGFTGSAAANAYWMTVSAEIDVGPDGIVAWGAYDSTGGGDNSGTLYFYLYGLFDL